ncbi:hypothetical protein RSOLAG22IIIB_09894 [Rhizoctonia solani]|uniref:Uncharacterized protein n=1 Tax=Rhizoctonia solani TaxID=456999 RepID=A0A0K6G0M2_9AGAM|nr:hypothetical protein RSOLAG22IIIB_09894 [Rhizoctonia solani]
MTSRRSKEREAIHEQEDKDPLVGYIVGKKLRNEDGVGKSMHPHNEPIGILQVEELTPTEHSGEPTFWETLGSPKSFDIERFEVIDTYLVLEFTPDTYGSKPKQISLQQYLGYPLGGTEGIILVLCTRTPGKGKDSPSKYMRSSVLEDRLAKNKARREEAYFRDSSMSHTPGIPVSTAIDLWNKDGKHEYLERSSWDSGVTKRREGWQYRKWWEFAENCVRGEANASKRSFIKARFWDGSPPDGAELYFTTSDDITQTLFDSCLKAAFSGLSFQLEVAQWKGNHGVDLGNDWELLGTHFLDLYRLYIRYTKDQAVSIHKQNYADLNSNPGKVRDAVREVQPTDQQARKQVANMLSAQSLNKKLKKLEAYKIRITEALRGLANDDPHKKGLRSDHKDVTQAINEARFALLSISDNAMAYASTNAHPWATITYLSRGKLNGAVAQKRAISQKTAMNGHSATTVAGIFGWTNRDPPHNAKYHAEWLHRSAFSFGGLGVGVRLDSSQTAKNMIFGSVEANTIMIRPEDTIKHLVKHIGGNYNDDAIIGMVTTIAKPLKCNQTGSEYDEDPDPTLQCIWLVKELEYTIHVQLSKLAPDRLRGQINDIIYTTSFNPCSRKTPLLLEARLDEEIEKVWFERKFPKPASKSKTSKALK